MTIKRFITSAVIVPASILALVACSSDSDNDGAGTDNSPAEIVLFDEITDGDIVDDPNNPQPFQLVVGENRINATVSSGDLDYITINVPAGSELTGILLSEYTTVDVEEASFLAVQAGSVFTVLPANATAEIGNLLGHALFGTEEPGTDILPAIAAGEGAEGFTPPLEAGDYSFWIQETGPDAASYSLTFVVE